MPFFAFVWTVPVALQVKIVCKDQIGPSVMGKCQSLPLGLMDKSYSLALFVKQNFANSCMCVLGQCDEMG